MAEKYQFWDIFYVGENLSETKDIVRVNEYLFYETPEKKRTVLMINNYLT